MDFLETILAFKREEVALRKRTVLRSTLEEMPGYGQQRLSLAGALRGTDMAMVAEIRRSAAGGGRTTFDPLSIARRCIQGGARALSIPTDRKFLRGHFGHVAAVRRFVSVPVMCRDFVIDSYQICEARASGADAVLLLASALDRRQLAELAEEARLLGLERVVEARTEEEIEALDASLPEVVAVNNRDLMTLDTDILTSVRLRKLLPPETVVISENGIRTPRDIRILMQHNVHAVLVGEIVQKAEDPAAALRRLLADAGEQP